jgi:hypothetical protein
VTASLWRRLTDLGTDAEARAICDALGHPGLRGVAPESLLTTQAVLHRTGPDQAPLLAEAMRRVAEAAGRRQFVAILSQRQAEEMASQSALGERVLRVIQQAAQKTPLPQRVKDYSVEERLVPGDPGGPWGVVRLVDGALLRDRIVRDAARTRRSVRWTVSDEAAAWVLSEAQRRGSTQSDVVDEVLTAAAASVRE